MKILVRFNKNISTPRQVKSFKVFDLGVVTTTIDDLLDITTIEIDDQTLPILKLTDNSIIKYYLINNVGLTPGLTYPYYTDDFTKDITINDLILISLGNNIGNHSELNLDDGTNPHGTTKLDVDLGNVDNTSDVNKPISTATQSALNLKENSSNKSTTITGNETSNSLFPTVKAIVDWAIGKFQDILVSGTNIKTINGNSILGSGDLVITEKLITNASVAGTYNIDWSNDVWDLTLTGNTTLTESNAPASGTTKTITLEVSGNFTLSYPSSWTTGITGAYSGTATLNTITIQTFGSKRKVLIVQPT